MCEGWLCIYCGCASKLYNNYRASWWVFLLRFPWSGLLSVFEADGYLQVFPGRRTILALLSYERLLWVCCSLFASCGYVLFDGFYGKRYFVLLGILQSCQLLLIFYIC